MKHDRFLHVKFLHFCDDKKDTDSADDNYNQLWKMGTMIDKLDSCSKCYSPTEHVAVDEIIVLFKSRVIFKPPTEETERVWKNLQTL
jgi:hypothetical protein